MSLALPIALGFGFVVVLAFMALRIISKYEEAIRLSTTSAIDFVSVPIRVIHDATSGLTDWLWTRANQAFARIDPIEKGEWEGAPVVGAFFYAAIVSANMYAEIWLLVMTLPLLGFSTGTTIPHSATWLTATAAISLTLFWGGMYLEARGLTKSTPWRRRPEKELDELRNTSKIALALLVVTLAAIGIYRGLEMAGSHIAIQDTVGLDPFAPELDSGFVAAPLPPPSAEDAKLQETIQWADRVMPPFVNGMLLILGGLTFALGKWSIPNAIGYVIGAACALIRLVIYPIHMATRIANEMYETLRGPLVSDFTHLGHLSAKELFDLFARRKDEAFEQDAAEIQKAKSRHEEELAAELLRRAGRVNGHSPSPQLQSEKENSQ
jgi:hypothetical protein